MIRGVADYWPVIPAVVLLPVLLPLFLMLFFFLSLAAFGLFFYQYFLAPIKPRPVILRSVEAGQNGNNETPARVHTKYARRLPKTPFGDRVKTLSDLLQWSVETYGSRPMLGSRKVIRTEEVSSKVMVDGKEVEKKLKIPTLSEYQWKSFTEIFDEMRKFSAGLVKTGTKLKELNDKVALFANTRAEWQVAAQAAFYRGLTVVTVYPSLGPDALAYALEQTEVTHVVTQVALMDNILKASDKLPRLTTIIYFDSLTAEQLNNYRSKYSRLQFYSYAEVLELGADKAAPAAPPKENDIAVIMFTSGSTGAPKGVLMSHKNILSTICAIAFGLQQPLVPDDVYIAYLPLAHILEMEAELGIISVGGRIGYATPTTLRDEQARNESGKGAGDLTELKPTLMAAVPLVLDRIRAGVLDKIHKRGAIMGKVFSLALYLKERAWLRGEAAPILDEYIFKAIRQNFGGRLRLILSGGAPLSKETHKFITLTVNVPVLQGYGLSESCAGGTLTEMDEQTMGIVGPPIACCKIKLVDIPDMNYLSTDKPNPRGEIWISGDNITLGYFKMPDKTAEDFLEEKDGTRWFKTGDVGQLLDDGNFQIIDRKKDLVKLVHGEYIALGRIENALIQSQFIENVCVYGDGKHDRPIALVVPNLATLGKALASEGVPDSYLQDLKQVSTHPKAAQVIHKSFEECANRAKLEKWERVGALKLCDFVWTPESGLLTEAFKLKRHEITKRFKNDIETTYANIRTS